MTEFVRHSKDEFLHLFESGEIQAEVVEHVTKLTGEPADGEQRSWNNSYAFMDIVLRDEQIPANVEVICECSVGGRRADMVLLSPADERGKHRAIVVELKQWDRFFLKGRKEYGAGENDPVTQAAEYVGLFDELKDELDVEAAVGCVYLHNVKEDDYRTLRSVSDDSRRGSIRVFYQGDTEKFRAFIRQEFEGDALSPTHAIARAQESGYWPDTLPTKPGVLRERLIELGLAQPVENEAYHYEPTAKGRRLGIRRFVGYDQQKKKPFVICSFTDTAMRRTADALLAADARKD